MNAAQFNQVVRAFGEQVVPRLVQTAQKKVCFDGARKLIKRTPVKHGRARGGWQVAIGNRPQGQVERLDPSGDATIAAANAVIEKIVPFCVCHITNNVDYILDLENGHSAQAPNGMLAVTFEELASSLS